MPNPLPLPKGRADRRKLLIYGGVAVALLVVIILRRSQGGAQQQPEQPLTAVSNPAGDAGGFVGGDNGAQLASFESGLLDQLPQVIESGIAAGFANYVPPPSTAAAPAAPSTVDIGGILQGVASLISVGTGFSGAGNGASQSAGPAQNIGAIPHPAAPPAGIAPAPNYPTYTPAQQTAYQGFVASQSSGISAEHAAVKNAPKEPEYTVSYETRHGVKGQVHHYPDGHNIWVPHR